MRIQRDASARSSWPLPAADPESIDSSARRWMQKPKVFDSSSVFLPACEPEGGFTHRSLKRWRGPGGDCTSNNVGNSRRTPPASLAARISQHNDLFEDVAFSSTSAWRSICDRVSIDEMEIISASPLAINVLLLILNQHNQRQARSTAAKIKRHFTHQEARHFEVHQRAIE